MAEASSPPTKRRKISVEPENTPNANDAAWEQELALQGVGTPATKSLERPISPPPSRRMRSKTPEPSTPRVQEERRLLQQASKQQTDTTLGLEHPKEEEHESGGTTFLPSPIQLTQIRDLAPQQNVDCVTLRDILGDPMIKECWNFNFLFDVDFVMQHFDADVQDIVKVKIVHGFWKRDDERRIRLMEASERYTNVDLISAYMPDPFGTHHCKMMVLFRHDDQVQVVIHTANMISRDWGNMTQAVWRSPLLPLLTPESELLRGSIGGHDAHAIGNGDRFKFDLIRYLQAYGDRLKQLITQLKIYDFTSIRAAFIGSTPSRQKLAESRSATQTSWGWLGLREILSSIRQSDRSESDNSPPNIVMQVSSIATLGPTPAWLAHFQSVLSQTSNFSEAQPTVAATTSFTKASSFFTPRTKSAISPTPTPTFNIIFPTPQEIRTSLDGYQSGHSIHVKLQSSAQQKQLQYMHPLYCHWKHKDTDSTPVANSTANSTKSTTEIRKAERGFAAPHIKTYIRFNDAAQRTIDWAMVTSANLSKQAWGELTNKNGEVWIQSWETGVVVWPALFSSPDGSRASMVPMFGRDMPDTHGNHEDEGERERDMKEVIGRRQGKEKVVVGFRMPYDLPLEPYGKDDVPWCASSAYEEPDWMGRVWGGYQQH